MKNKKLTMILPCALLLVGGVTGITACDSGDGSLSIPDEITDDVSINFWVTFNDSYIGTIEAIVEQFNKIYPNITVNIEKQTGSYSDLEDIILNGIPANSYPNMAICYPDHVADYIDTGKVIQMDKYMEDPVYGWTEDDFNDVLPNLLATGQNLQVEGTWCLPFAASSEAMFYNADALIGLNLSAYDSEINGGSALDANYFNSLTWEELIDHLFPALEKANEDPSSTLYQFINTTSNLYSGIMGYDSDDNLFITLAEQYGYDYTGVNTATGKGEILFDNEGMKGLMRTFNSLYNRGIDPETKQDNLKYFTTEGTNGDNYTNSYFVNRGFLFSIGSTGGTKYQLEGNTDTVGVARIPQAEGKDTKCICQGPSICFFNKGGSQADEEALACWLFYDYLTNTANTCKWALETGYMPIRESAYYDDEWLSLSNTEGQTGEDLTYAEVYSLYAEIASSLFTSPAFKGSAEARTQVGSIMTQCLVSEDLDAVVDKDDDGNDILEIDRIFSNAVNQALLAM